MNNGRNIITMESKGVNKEDIERMYVVENMSLARIAKVFKVGENKVKLWLKECNIPLRKYTQKFRFNENYFDEIDSEEKAYWLGFIWCDGSIIDQAKNLQIKLSLSDTDISHVYKFKEAIDAEHTVKTYDISNGFMSEEVRQEARIVVTSKHMGETLRNKYGMVTHRSTSLPVTEKIPKSLVRHFIRGVFDADGSITTYWNKGKESWNPNLKMSLQLYSTEDLIDFIQDHWIEIGFKNNKVKTIKRHKDRDGSATGICFSGVDQVTWLLNYLYEDSRIYLDRKMDSANDAHRIKLERKLKKEA